jgi:hypothetical protein
MSSDSAVTILGLASEARTMVASMAPGQLEKLACGRFSDSSFVSAGKKRGFCRLRRAMLAR